jgi:nitronate monooxygenase
MILDSIAKPIVLAPLAGGPFTPALAAAVSEAGGLGFVASGYLSATDTRASIAATRAATDRPIGVNLFVPGAPANPSEFTAFLERLRSEADRAGVELGPPRHDDDDWTAKLALMIEDPLPVVSFTFGCPSSEVTNSLRAVGSEVWVTVTSVDEAVQASEAGADVLVVQGGEAGGHRGSFIDRPDIAVFGLLPLIQMVRAAVEVPLVAAGGIATGPAVAAVLCAGAHAAQLGTAFLRCPEAGTAEVHREALASSAPTTLTRAFSGRLARGIRNRFIDEYSDHAPVAYPEINHVTSYLRKAGRERGDKDLVNLWAGEAHQLARELPAAEIVRGLAADAHAALAAASKLVTGALSVTHQGPGGPGRSPI